jgi:hypothetical protein
MLYLRVKGGGKVRAAMGKKRRIFTTEYTGFSRRTVLLGLALIASLCVASLVDLTATLEYFKIIRGATIATLETGATISLACAIPFLALGMSIADDGRRNR